MKILVIEDDARLAHLLEKGLSRARHVVDWADSGTAGITMASNGPYDAAVIDVMLPDMDGYAVSRRLRANQETFPILILTARDTVDDKVFGLRSGADDYMTKPFSFDELLARLDALARRPRNYLAESQVTAGPLALDPHAQTIRCQDHLLDLTLKEFLVLELLMRHPNQVLSRDLILDRVWNALSEPATNVVDAVIARLRKKITAALGNPLIQTVRGFGYVIRT
ncbi:MAG: response regulator transcription factor [Thermaerobacter sp.]|nr:response regulator transcription factor [Thermaerobacter sp.]